MTRVDVLVVGAGVAGSAAAIGLSREGLDVMLIDRAAFPRHKVCGCCLNKDAVDALDGLGLRQSMKRIGAAPIERVVVRSGQHSIALRSRGGMAVSRYALDAMLRDVAVDAGCRFQDQTSARISEITDDSAEWVPVHCSGPSAYQGVVHAHVVLVADGLAGSCMAGIKQAKRSIRPDSLRGYGAQLPAGQHAQPGGGVEMHCGRLGYVGTVVLEDGSLDIAAAMNPVWVKSCRGPAVAVQTIFNQSGLTLPGLGGLAWKATAPLTGGRPKRWMPRVFFLGDSAGYVEPFTGEGMAWALRSARALQPIASCAVHGWDDRLGYDWQRAYRYAVQHRQWRCRLFSYALRRPPLVTSLVRLGAALPSPAKQAVARSFLPPMFHAKTPPNAKEPVPT